MDKIDQAGQAGRDEKRAQMLHVGLQAFMAEAECEMVERINEARVVRALASAFDAMLPLARQ